MYTPLSGTKAIYTLVRNLLQTGVCPSHPEPSRSQVKVTSPCSDVPGSQLKVTLIPSADIM